MKIFNFNLNFNSNLSFLTIGSHTTDINNLTTVSQNDVSKPNDLLKPVCSIGDGYYSDKSSRCKKYYICTFSNTPYETINFLECPENTLFDETVKTCNIKEKVIC
jgi:hypothetical protein